MGAPGAVESKQFIVLFDGVCNLCNASVQFILKRDPDHRFKFASLQSAFGQQKLKEYGYESNDLVSIMLVTKRGVLQRSDAALEIAKHLSGLWFLLYVFKIIPRFIRDAIYNWVARNRYSFFGKRTSCWIPTPDLSSRFLE